MMNMKARPLVLIHHSAFITHHFLYPVHPDFILSIL